MNAMLTMPMRRNSTRSQQGRTLIELLIAMVLSLMIVAAVGTLYSFSSNSARTAAEIGTVEERGKIAMHFISDPIALASYGNINNGEIGGAARMQVTTFKGPHLRGCTNGRFADAQAGDFTCVASALPGDELHVGFQGESVTSFAQGVNGAAMDDCLGSGAIPVQFPDDPGLTIPAVYNQFSVFQAPSGALELGCRGGAAAAIQGLIRDVEDFKVYFAFDGRGYQFANGGQQLSSALPSRLMTATQINALPGAADAPEGLGNPWNHVVAVHICVLVRSTQAGTTADGTSVFQPCPQDEVEAANGTATATLNDGFSRRSFTEVFTLRARTQAHAGSKAS